MKWWSLIVPALGILVAASEPLVRYTVRDRHERLAIDVLQRVFRAQQVFHDRAGAFATELTSLTTTCDGRPAPLEPSALTELAAAGYRLELRAARDAAPGDPDCHGVLTATDYYFAAAPVSAETAARQAFAGRGDGRLFLFYDGVPPLERDIATGLATPVTERESFRIP